MVVLKKNTLNTEVCFTLNEKTTLDPFYYILSLKGNQSNNVKNLMLNTDVSLNKTRWNEYEIEEVILANEDLMNQKINLTEGTYDYQVWQSSTNSNDITLATSIVESGRLKVEGADVQYDVYPDDNSNGGFVFI